MMVAIPFYSFLCGRSLFSSAFLKKGGEDQAHPLRVKQFWNEVFNNFKNYYLEENRMKKLIVWAVALCFVFSFSFVYAAEKTTPGELSPDEPTKSVQDVKKKKAPKKKVKKDRGAKPVDSVVKDKGGMSNPVEAPAGSPGEPSKDVKEVKKERMEKKEK
jgi:hypothetical protein